MSLFDNNWKSPKSNGKNTMNRGSEWNDITRDAFKQELSEPLSEEQDKTDVFLEQKQAVKQEKSSKSKENTFKEEFSEVLMNDASRFGVQSYSNAGVTFEKLSDTQAKIKYSGLLAKDGAPDVYGVYGFGSNQKWENVSDLTLNKESESSFTATISLEQGKNINFAFKDSAEHWDNNSGKNYTFVN